MAIQTSLTSEEFRRSITESRQKFLDVLCDKSEDTEEDRGRQNETNRKKYASRKISFKVRKSSSTYRKNFVLNVQKTTLTASSVSDLASKFNEIIEKQNASNDDEKLRKLVRKLSNFSTVNNSMTMKQTNINSTNEIFVKEPKKPSIKKKPVLDEKFKIHNSKRKNLSTAIPSKPEDVKLTEDKIESDMTNENLRKAKSIGFVKAAIENFEKKSVSPLITKRSMSEIHKIHFREDLDSDRRKSCKPDIIVAKEEEIVKENQFEDEIEKSTIRQREVDVSDNENKFNFDTNKEQITVIDLYSISHRDNSSTDDEPIVNFSVREVNVVEESEEESHYISSMEERNEVCENQTEASVDASRNIVDQYHTTLKTEGCDSDINSQNIQFKPNSSFLWNKCSTILYQDNIQPNSLSNFGTIGPRSNLPFSNENNASKTLPKDFKGISLLEKEEVYEELDSNDGYEPFEINSDYEEVEIRGTKEESLYEYLHNEVENIYETLPSTKRESKQDEPLPERPISNNSGSYFACKNVESESNCYESIYNNNSSVTEQTDNNYESIYFKENSVQKENSDKDIAGSIVSSEQKTNSLYGTSLRSWNEGTIYNGSATSDISFSDKSEWIDVSENEDYAGSKIIIIREASKSKKNGSWSQQCRQQWMKTEKNIDYGADTDSDHHYETLRTSEDEGHDQDFCSDSFSSDTESEDSFENFENNEHSCDLPLPAAPNSNDVLTRLAASATKHMRKFTKNLSMTRNDISKSLTRITRRKSKSDVNETVDNSYVNISKSPVTTPTSEMSAVIKTDIEDNNEKNKSLSRKGFLNKIRRSIIMSPEQANEITSQFNKGKSTFYLTPTINIDDPDDVVHKRTEEDSGISLSPVDRNSRNRVIKPQYPPPPVPIAVLNEDLKKKFQEKRLSVAYAEENVNRTSELKLKQKERSSSTCWYDEIGLYQKSLSTPSSSSAENSGTNTNAMIKPISPKSFHYSNHEKENSINYNNIGLENNYYNSSIHSLNSNGTKTDLSLTSLPGDDIQMRLQNEPLYQFYDAAVLDYVCQDGISDMDSETYEDVERRMNTESRPTSRPTAMELTSPKRNVFGFTKTLWCEIPEVLQSSVLSTLSSHQKKLQEAKFEMITSEASYLNSLNVLNDHFIANLRSSLDDSERELLFGKIEAVRESSNKLLLDLEKCWQDNILLHGVCDIIQKHAEEEFSVYIPYCENHMLLEQLMKKLRDRPSFADTLKQLEASPVCECLSLYSFLMLPMQRITRWPLLLDAVLKRLEQHDSEYITCQYVLATINKIVSQCNEAARNKERELEMLRIESKMEYGRGVLPLNLAIPNRWLVRSGSVTHIQPKAEEIKLTFGKKISKATLHLFLFNDLLIVTKSKSENSFTVMHYCSRNFTELSTSDQLLSIPGKDMTGKYLFFLTILENQNKKTVEFLLSCSSESDKQRWIEALSPPKSEDPDEVLYECWDCPQVTVIHNYTAVQPDELNLSKGDIINVSRKMADGWYQGERIRDGQTGWFPANYTVEIANPHVRARNLKQRYRLLTYSETYLKNK